jgi:hypothetical protein
MSDATAPAAKAVAAIHEHSRNATRHDIHRDRKLERTPAMLIKRKERRAQGPEPAR